MEMFLWEREGGDVSRELNLVLLEVLSAALVLGFPLGICLGLESRHKDKIIVKKFPITMNSLLLVYLRFVSFLIGIGCNMIVSFHFH